MRRFFFLSAGIALIAGAAYLSPIANGASPPVYSSLTTFYTKALANVSGTPNVTNGAWVRYDGEGMLGGFRTADTATAPIAVSAQSAWAQATSNTSGANLNVGPGLGRRKVALTSANCGTDTVTFTTNGTGHALVEGTDWNKGASDSAAATSLTAAVNALAIGIKATASSGTVFVQQNPDALATPAIVDLAITTTDVTCAAITSGTDGTANYWGATAVKGAATFASTIAATGAITPTGGISLTVASSANQACTTTCTTHACLFGQNAGGNFLACSDATADTCVCGP